MPSRTLREQPSPRQARQRRTRNGWLILVFIVCLSLSVDLVAHLVKSSQHAAVQAHSAISTISPASLPRGCGTPDASDQQQATAVLAHVVALPATLAPLRVIRDANGTLVIMCMAAAPQDGHDALQRAFFSHGWQVAADITATSTLSMTFLHAGTVVFVTITAQPTTPPTTQIVMMLPA